MLSRLFMVLSVWAGLMAVAVGQCGTNPVIESCTVVQMATSDRQTVTVSLTFDAAGDICGVGGSISGGSNFAGQLLTITGLTGTGNSVTYSGSGNSAIVTRFNRLTFATAFNPTSTSALSSTVTAAGGGSLTSAPGTVIQTAESTNLNSPFTPGGDMLGAALVDFCNAAGGGDPFFSGFQGQQYFVKGETGAVLNIVSSFNMQFNAKLIYLGEDTAIMPQEQERLFLLSQIRHASNPSVAALPATTYWSHPGNYFGELGVAMVEGHRLYAKPGSYKWGWDNVTLDGADLLVSDKYIVLSSDVNTITISRPSTHQITIRTLNVELSMINSDHFFNIEHSHLEAGFTKHKNFAGIMGKSADGKWKWSQEAEDEATVKSGDLFEFMPQAL